MRQNHSLFQWNIVQKGKLMYPWIGDLGNKYEVNEKA